MKNIKFQENPVLFLKGGIAKSEGKICNDLAKIF